MKRSWLIICFLVLGTTAASAQTGVDQPTPPPPGTVTVYLVNFSQGRALFIISPHGPRAFFGGEENRPKDETVACDVASSSIFRQNTLFPGSWCRIYVNAAHDLWLWAVTYYPTTRCSEYGCWKQAYPYYTRRVHLTGLTVGGLYEFDACGAIGVNEATCGWREISPQDRVY